MSGYWTKAQIAASAAHRLLDVGDTDGAVNRAYYAMFGAARAALQHIDPELAQAKTHNTILRRFNKHMVLDGDLDRAFGKYLNTAEDIRIAADYHEGAVAFADAQRIVARMDEFLSAIAATLSKDPP